MSEGREYTARTVRQALIRASEDLGIPVDRLHYEVLDERRRYFGFGGRLVKIRVVEASAVPQPPPEPVTPEPTEHRKPRRPRRAEAEGERRDRPVDSGRRTPAVERDEREPERRARERPERREPERRARERSERREPERREPAAAPPRRRRSEPREEPVDRVVSEREAETFTRKVIEAMGFDLDVSAEWTAEHLLVELEGDDCEFLLANHADGLDALQYLVNSAFSRATGTKPRIVIDCDGYREARRAELVEMALEAAEEVRRTGEKRTLNPMNPYDRRAVHLELNDEPEVRTYSVGEGLMKRVIVAPAGSGGDGRSRRGGGGGRR